MDETAEKTNIHLKSCRRQFDNVKRIFKAVEETPGGIVDNVQKMFHVCRPLAEFYATFVFIGGFRFEMTKKKLAPLTFEAIMKVSLILMKDWMVNDDLDREFFASLKELKALLERDKEHRNVVCNKLQNLPELVSTKSYSEIEGNFKMLSRNLILFGAGLSGGGGKDVRDFFVNLMEKLIEPLKAFNLEKGEVEQFLKAYRDTVVTDVIIVEESVKRALDKFMKTLLPAILAIY